MDGEETVLARCFNIGQYCTEKLISELRRAEGKLRKYQNQLLILDERV